MFRSVGWRLLWRRLSGWRIVIVLIGEAVAVEHVREVPVPLLEKELSDVNIYLSDTDVNKIRGELRHDPAYQALANDCLALLKGKQLISPVPLDSINGKYKNELGLRGNAYIAADRYDASGKLGRAIYEAWLVKQPPGRPEKSFGEIIVPRGG